MFLRSDRRGYETWVLFLDMAQVPRGKRHLAM